MTVLNRRNRGSNNLGVWLLVAISFVILFIVYISFSLNEERNLSKIKLKKPLKINTYQETSSKAPAKQEDVSSFTLGMIRTDEELERYNIGYKLHAFNEFVSDRIGFQARDLPDTRPHKCSDVTLEVQAQVSVIICYYNEALSALMRTINSVFKRTSPKLLKEVIVVNDGSRKEFDSTIEDLLESKYLRAKIHVLKSENQTGLIRARMFGARHATGDTIVFLDSHCEVNEGWIEPLLHRLVNHTSRVVSPVVDTIHPDTFKYEAADIVRGGFNWGLNFGWEALPNHGDINSIEKTYQTPTIAGGLFATNREAFFNFGGYDEAMEEWGGENLELSFRTWMCGGSLEINPCSRVGHVFRRRRPYGGHDGAALRNAVRLASVWLDDYKVFFEKTRPEAASIDPGDISKRIELRNSLKCHDFQWYLSNVYPEIGIPGVRKSTIQYNKRRPRSYTKAQGHIRVAGLSICLNVISGKNAILQAGSCDKEETSTTWIYNSQGEILLSGTKSCLEGSSSTCRLSKCDGSLGWQNWRFLNSDLQSSDLVGKIYNVAIGLCLSINQNKDSFEIAMRICNNPTVQTFSISKQQ